MALGGGLWALCVAWSLGQAGDPAPDAAMPPVKVVRAFVQAYRTYKPMAMKPLLAEGVSSPLSVDPAWLALPPVKKAWGAQKLKPGKPTPVEGAMVFAVEASLLDVAPLLDVVSRVDAAVKDLPPPRAAKKRKELALEELAQINWTYRDTTFEVRLVKTPAGWRVASTGLDAAPAKPAPTAAATATPAAPAEEEVEEIAPTTAAGYHPPSKKALAAYPAALLVLRVEGVALESAFKGKVVAAVNNDGSLPVARVRANVIYTTSAGAVTDSGRSFVFAGELLCPKTTGSMETEAMPPGERAGFSGQIKVEITSVDFDRPDAFGRLRSQSCGASASP